VRSEVAGSNPHLRPVVFSSCISYGTLSIAVDPLKFSKVLSNTLAYRYYLLNCKVEAPGSIPILDSYYIYIIILSIRASLEVLPSSCKVGVAGSTLGQPIFI
jgi:hypothetical protein